MELVGIKEGKELEGMELVGIKEGKELEGFELVGIKEGNELEGTEEGSDISLVQDRDSPYPEET